MEVSLVVDAPPSTIRVGLTIPLLIINGQPIALSKSLVVLLPVAYLIFRVTYLMVSEVVLHVQLTEVADSLSIVTKNHLSPDTSLKSVSGDN